MLNKWRRLDTADKRRWLIVSLALILTALLIICRVTPDAPVPHTEDVPLNVLWPDGEVRETGLEQFICGVVAAEMPAQFDPAALAAQAVAARTYVAARMLPGKAKHGAAAVCTDPACCQAYLSESALRKRWGDGFDAYYHRIKQAVADTAGLTLRYDGALAETLFCSCCGGRTESAADCWGRDITYLRSVECGYCINAPRFAGRVTMTDAEAAQAMGLTEQELKQMHVAAYTAGGRVATLSAGTRSISGTQARTLLSLDSAAFCWLTQGNETTFFTLGYGHGVGLCQWGAQGMAASGSTWQQILAHYYPGTTVGE